MSVPDTSYYSRIERLFVMAWLIEKQPRQWTRAMLAQRFGVSERRITSDLAVIRYAHYKWLKNDRGQGYYFKA